MVSSDQCEPHLSSCAQMEKEREAAVILSGRWKLLGVWGLWGILYIVGFTLYSFIKETTYNPVY